MNKNKNKIKIKKRKKTYLVYVHGKKYVTEEIGSKLIYVLMFSLRKSYYL